MPLNLKAPKNRSTVSLVFVNQLTPDIHHELQRLEGFKGKRLAESIAVAEKVYNHRRLLKIGRLWM